MFSLPWLVLFCWLALVTVQGRKWSESSTDSHISIANLRTALGKIGFVFHEEARFHHQEEIAQLSASVDKSSKHNIVFAVQQRNLDSLLDILHDVSMPSSANYGKHWTRQQIANLTSNPVGAAHVVTFLKEYGFEVISVTKFHDYITASGTIAQWEVFFNTDFRVFHDNLHNRRFVRALKHSLPKSIVPNVMGVFGASDYFLDYNENPAKSSLGAAYSALAEDIHMSMDVVHHQDVAEETGGIGRPTASGDLWCLNVSGNVTLTFCVTYPQLLFRVYNVPLPVSNASVSQAIFASLDQSFSPDDLELFQTALNLTVQPIAGAYNGHVFYNACLYDTENCDEASLDVQYITSMAQGVPTYFDYVQEPSSGSPFVDWILTVANMSDPADVFSISYSSAEAGLSISTLTTFNTEAQKLGIAGVTIVCSSGDNGAITSQAKQDPPACKYAPGFPSVSPFVTSVGASQGPEYGDDEVTCQVPNSLITSGGGFSSMPNPNAVPAWQTASVSAYLSLMGPSLTTGYGRGRGYPDVAMLGNNYVLVFNESTHVGSGTSASAPVFAGVVSVVNSWRNSVGLSTMGFLNPWLYTYASDVVNDITVGNNTCTSAYDSYVVADSLRFVGTCCAEGFIASPGWDPVTGLGSIDAQRFLSKVQQLANFTAQPSASPSVTPTWLPTTPPSPSPSSPPTVSPTAFPTTSPTVSPTISPTNTPTVSPTDGPSVSPTVSPTDAPAVPPTASPTDTPSVPPTASPTTSPTDTPTVSPTETPTVTPTASPTVSQTVSPTDASTTMKPSMSPSLSPSSGAPSSLPTSRPTSVTMSAVPSLEPSVAPSLMASTAPTQSAVSNAPSASPSTVAPTSPPSEVSTATPSATPSQVAATTPPTVSPTTSPTASPSTIPSASPSVSMASPAPSAPSLVTPAPSFAPTSQTVPILSFTSLITLVNVASPTLAAADEASIAAATATSMGLAFNDVVFVSYTSVTSVSSSLRRLADRRRLATSYTVVTEVETSVLLLGDISADVLYTTLTQSLTNAVDASNVFSSALQSYAAQNNAQAMATATASAVVNGSPEETTPPSSPSSSKDPIDDPRIVAVIVVVIVAVLLMVVGGCWWVRRQGAAGLFRDRQGMASKAEDIVL